MDGVDVGEAPLVASVRCAPASPYPAQRRVTTCRVDVLVELSVEMGR